MAEQTMNSGIKSTLRQAGVAEITFSTAMLRIEERCELAMTRIHSQPGFRTKLIDLPRRTGNCAGNDPSALCLRPGEWLLISDTTDPADLREQLAEGIESGFAAVYDQSDGLAVFRLDGPAAPWLLGKLSGLDFLAAVDEGEHCARTRMGAVAVLIHYHEAQPGQFVFDLVFDRSLAKYLWDLLLASAPHADELANDCGFAA
jgi:heterotetrameric sarcosine oxidase gamma subunit